MIILLKGKFMENILNNIFIKRKKEIESYEKNADNIIKRVKKILVRTQEMTDQATLNGESEWCLKLVKKENLKDDCSLTE